MSSREAWTLIASAFVVGLAVGCARDTIMDYAVSAAVVLGRWLRMLLIAGGAFGVLWLVGTKILH